MKVEFSGGLDTVFGGEKSLEISVPKEGTTIKNLLDELAQIAQSKGGNVDLFLQDGLVRPGILVLVNDADWELMEKEDTEIFNRDVVHFSSTLHGG